MLLRETNKSYFKGPCHANFLLFIIIPEDTNGIDFPLWFFF